MWNWRTEIYETASIDGSQDFSCGLWWSGNRCSDYDTNKTGAGNWRACERLNELREQLQKENKIIKLRSCLWRTQYIEHKALHPSAACLRNNGNITKLLHFKIVNPFIKTSMTEQQSKKVSLGALLIMLQGHITHLRNFVNYYSCKHCNSWGKF